MKPANNLREVVPGLWCWSSTHEEWKVEFSSCAWSSPQGLVLIDPIALAPASLAQLETVGRPAAILLTNENHERDADAFRQRYGIQIHVHRDAVPGIEIRPDAFFEEGAAVAGGLKVIHLPGTCPSECAFHTEANGGVVLSGDVVTNGPQGLAFLPDNYCKDARQNRTSARKLLALSFETLTVAHGGPVHPQAARTFATLFNG